MKPFPLFAELASGGISLSGIPWFEENLSDLEFNVRPEYDAACRFLTSLTRVQQTFRSYRRDLERYLLWCWLVENTSCLSVTPSMITTFVGFLDAPPAEWVGAIAKTRFDGGEPLNGPFIDWRPFNLSRRKRDSLSQGSKAALFGALSSFYRTLQDDCAVDVNPFLSARRRSLGRIPRFASVADRLMTDLQLHYILHAARTSTNYKDEFRRARIRYVVSMLYYLGVRVSELCDKSISETQTVMATMGSIRKIKDEWFFDVDDLVAKGGKGRLIPIPPPLREEIKLFRAAYSQQMNVFLPSMPAHNEQYPLVPHLDGNGQSGSIGTRWILEEIKLLLSDAKTLMEAEANCARERGEQELADDLIREAQSITSISPHWFRHRCASDSIADGGNVVHTQQNLGHADLSTTTIYTHADLLDRSASSKRRRQV